MFFFFKQKTAYEMRISDWSSDVCSSDLAQRQCFSRFDGEPSADQLARYFHLDQTDRDLIGTLRGDHNRLGFTVMLTSARFLGAFPVSPSEIPASVLATVIEQLALEPATDRTSVV